MPPDFYTPITYTPSYYTDNTTYGWSSTGQVISYEVQPVPAEPPTPKAETALDWLRAQVDEIVQLGQRELVPA